MPKGRAVASGVNFTSRETLLLAATLNTLPGDISKVIDFDKVAAACQYKDASVARTMFQRLRRNKILGSTGDDETDTSEGQKKTKGPAKRKALKAVPNDDDAWTPTNKRAKTTNAGKRTKKVTATTTKKVHAGNQLAIEAGPAADADQNPVVNEASAKNMMGEGKAINGSAEHGNEGNAEQEAKANPGEKIDVGEQVVTNPGKIDAGEVVVAAMGEKSDVGSETEGRMEEETVAGQQAKTDFAENAFPGQGLVADLEDVTDAIPEVEGGVREIAVATQDVVAGTGNTIEIEGVQEVAAGVKEKVLAEQEIVVEQKEKIEVQTQQEGAGGPGEMILEKKQDVSMSVAEKVETGQDAVTSTGDDLYRTPEVIYDHPDSVNPGQVVGEVEEQATPVSAGPAVDASKQAEDQD